jgi:hypothetical protein
MSGEFDEDLTDAFVVMLQKGVTPEIYLAMYLRAMEEVQIQRLEAAK